MTRDSRNGDRPHGDQRDQPLDIPVTRRDRSVDEDLGGFQNVEGPGAAPGEHALGEAPGSDEARALDRGEEVEEPDTGSGIDSATTGSPHAPTSGDRDGGGGGGGTGRDAGNR